MQANTEAHDLVNRVPHIILIDKHCLNSKGFLNLS